MTDPEPSPVDPSVAKQVHRAADAIRAFATEHPEATATIEYLGRDRARVVLVAPGGAFGDVVLGGANGLKPVRAADDDGFPSISADAEAAVSLAGVPLKKWDRELSAMVDVTPAYRTRMAGTGR